jgi:hypothetical protein
VQSLVVSFGCFTFVKTKQMIKVTIGESKPQEKSFPKLMITTDNTRIVFFVSNRRGVQINGEKAFFDKFVHYSDNWAMELFTDYNEPITIQNA